jgi:hypothetical protein
MKTTKRFQQRKALGGGLKTEDGYCIVTFWHCISYGLNPQAESAKTDCFWPQFVIPIIL